jgi:hypothetical protein
VQQLTWTKIFIPIGEYQAELSEALEAVAAATPGRTDQVEVLRDLLADLGLKSSYPCLKFRCVCGDQL